MREEEPVDRHRDEDLAPDEFDDEESDEFEDWDGDELGDEVSDELGDEVSDEPGAWVVREGKQVGVALRSGRRRLGYNQRELAQRAGLNQATIARLEAGADARFSVVVRALWACGLELVAAPPAGAPREWGSCHIRWTRDATAAVAACPRICPPTPRSTSPPHCNAPGEQGFSRADPPVRTLPAPTCPRFTNLRSGGPGNR